MRYFLVVAFLSVSIFLSCSGGSSSSEEEVTVNGTWVLSTVQGVPASSTGISSTMKVTNSVSFSRTMTIPNLGTGTGTGTVASKGGSVYSFASSNPSGIDGVLDYTLSADGATLSNTTSQVLGPHAYAK